MGTVMNKDAWLGVMFCGMSDDCVLQSLPQPEP
jgi:hypothetical protein